MLTIFLLLLYGESSTLAGDYGYDAGGGQDACGRPYRAGRLHRPPPPCDLVGAGYCEAAGPAYPWAAVRRFVRENRGLMRRMYGDQRHDAVIRAELGDDPHVVDADPRLSRLAKERFRFDVDHELDLELEMDLHPEDNELSPPAYEHRYGPQAKTEGRHLKEDVLNTRFVYSEEPAITIRLKDIGSAPYFRPTSQKITTIKSTSTTTTASTTRTTDPETTTPTTTGTSTASTASTNTFTEEDSQERTTLEDAVTSTTTDQTVTTTTNLDSTTRTTTPTIDRVDHRDNLERNETKQDSKQPLNNVLFQDMAAEETKPQFNYNMRGVNACPVKEEVVAPFWANNTRGEVLALLNMYPFEQYVHWEKCTHELRQMYCREGCRCEQQYRLHRLLAYDPDNECRGIFSDWFRFPSCCVCKCYGLPQEFRVTSRSPRAAGLDTEPRPP